MKRKEKINNKSANLILELNIFNFYYYMISFFFFYLNNNNNNSRKKNNLFY